MNRNTNIATHTVIQLQKKKKERERERNYKHFRKITNLSMTFGLVISSNIQQKKPTSPNCEYVISHIYNFEHLLCEGPYLREAKDKLVNEPLTTIPGQAAEKGKHFQESSSNRRSWSGSRNSQTTSSQDSGEVEKRQETPIQRSYRLPRILLAGIHLG